MQDNLVGQWAFDTEKDALDYIATLDDPDSYTVKFDGFCWGVFETAKVKEQEQKQDVVAAELRALLNSLAF